MAKKRSIDRRLKNYSIIELNLSNRAYDTLMSAGIRTIGDLQLVNDDDLLKIHGFGPTCLAEVRKELPQYKRDFRRHTS